MHKKSAHTLHKSSAQRPWLWLVLVGFLWLQFAGMVHKQTHTELPLASSQLAGLSLEQLLPDHSQKNASDCQLFDLHSSGSALLQSMSAFVLPVLAQQTLWYQAATFSNTTWLAYQARAPPQTSI
ncbi:MAG: hypothetical protein RLY82_1004 [Pseudomonadota bacterium]|jgi:hypothetical protein